MSRLTGLVLSLTAAGALALAQSGTGTGSQAGQTGSQSGASGQTGKRDRTGATTQSDRDRSGTMGQAAGQTGAAAGGQLTAADRRFILEAAQGSMAEVKLAKLAQDKAASDQVKQVAQRIEKDHDKALDDLKTVASSKGVDLPQELDAKHQAKHDRLSNLSGAAFDQAYLRAMRADHNKDIAKFQKQAKSAGDEQVRDFASRTLPALQQHHDLVQQAMAANPSGSSANPRTDEPSGTTGKSGKTGTSGSNPDKPKP